jgi:predicted O-linked N-acetylglucosamine transferase (SPINDLY family)
MKRVLNVGGNSKLIALPPIYAGWEHHLLDIDPKGNPDIVCDARELQGLAPGQYDAIYCSHNLEHYYRHDVPRVLKGFLHLLKRDGFVHIRVPDMAKVMQETINRGLDVDDTLYESPMGPITVLDVIYGHGEQIARSGCEFFAHKTGFTLKSLVAMLERCGFPHVFGGAQELEIAVFAFPETPTEDAAKLLRLTVREGSQQPAASTTASELLQLTVAQLRDLCADLVAKGSIRTAIQHYRDWLAGSQSPLAYAAYFNLGCLLGQVGDLSGAGDAYQQALNHKSDFMHARANLGAIHEQQGKVDEAILEWQQIVEHARQNTVDTEVRLNALNNLGRVLELRRRFPEAEVVLTQSLTINPTQPEVIHHLVHLRQRQCAWPVYQEFPGLTKENLVQHTSALAMLSATNDPALQLATARRYVSELLPDPLPRLAPDIPYSHGRQRVGYLSSNFGRHAVSFLTAELYELHDRNRFEIYAFSSGRDDRSDMRKRIEAAMDHFISIEHMSDEAAAHAIRTAEIDILIDLQGLTLGVRPAILARRPAPIQVTYLGFPGSTASPWIDYVLADRYLIPESLEQYYSEKPLLMPNCFQVNDRKREIGPTPTRQQYGLPESAFIFCAFNHNYKITPELYDVWMNILRRTSGSLLWLLADNPTARDNLINEATLRGVASDRLIFAPRVPPSEYLARFKVADLFLDTFPFNGGTTASDALWAGLPLLTCSGNTFASRMAGSLLKGIKLDELITDSFAAYEDIAVHYANAPDKLNELRARLAINIHTTPLFDTPQFVKDLEALLTNVAIKA